MSSPSVRLCLAPTIWQQETAPSCETLPNSSTRSTCQRVWSCRKKLQRPALGSLLSSRLLFRLLWSRARRGYKGQSGTRHVATRYAFVRNARPTMQDRRSVRAACLDLLAAPAPCTREQVSTRYWPSCSAPPHAAHLSTWQLWEPPGIAQLGPLPRCGDGLPALCQLTASSRDSPQCRSQDRSQKSPQHSRTASGQPGRGRARASSDISTAAA